MRLTRQLGLVVLTYLTRPAFVILVVVGLASLDAMYIVRSDGYRVAFNIGLFLAISLINLLPVAMIVTFIFLFLSHVRQQLRGPLAALTPEYRNAHLIVAGTMFFGIVAVMSVWYYRANVTSPQLSYHTLSFFGVFLVFLTVMTFAALAGLGSLLWVLVLPLLGLALTSQKFADLARLFTYDNIDRYSTANPNFAHLSPYWQSKALTHQAEEIRVLYVQRATVLLFDLVALAVVVWRARPLTDTPWELRMIDRMLAYRRTKDRAAEGAAARRPHRQATSVLGRGWRRRFAVHSPHFAWAMAGILAGFGIFTTLIIGFDPHQFTTIAQSLVMATVIPGVVVAAGWRERWPSLGYESLLPSGRDQFVLEMAVAMAIDLAEFWVAGWAGALAPMLIWEPRFLLSGQLLASVLASGLMQVLLFGGILLMARWRTGMVFTIVLLVFMLAVLVPLLETWSQKPALKSSGLVVVALVEMAAGLVMAAVGHAAWRRTTPA